MFNTGIYELEDAQQPLPSDGTVTHLFVRLDGSPSPGKYLFHVMNGASAFAVAPGCVIESGDTECSDRSRCGEYNAGDLISLRAIPTDNPAPVAMSWTAVFTPNATCPCPEGAGVTNAEEATEARGELSGC